LTELWYDMDEVREFHPVVERALKEAICRAGYSEKLIVEHHPQIPGGEPDFVLLLKDIGRPVFVLEIKRTKADCDSVRFWAQTQEYVDALSTKWAPSYYPFSAITNVERLVTFCRRSGPAWGCVLSGNPCTDAEFDLPGPGNADKALTEFISSMERILDIIMRKEKPKWAETWPIVIDSFGTNYGSIRGHLVMGDKSLERDVTSYELLRILLYGYLRELYNLYKSEHLQLFRRLPQGIYPPMRFGLVLLNTFRRVLDLDFEQVFRDHPDKYVRILPEKADITIMSCLNDFVTIVNSHLPEAVEENPLPSYFVKLIKEKIYDREEMHKEGKITTDDELASILAWLCIEGPDVQVIDVGTGIGALSKAAYDRIKQLSRSLDEKRSHNKLLSQISGIEKDSFLNQLATFQLIAKDPRSVDTNTKIDFVVGDAFENPRPEQFDVVLMNPPFLRHDNKVVPITDEMEGHMLQAIEKQYGRRSFVREASQPNLYFYFLNWIPHYLRPGGVAGIILMAKFLNNVDGEYVKEFILDKLESIVLYPRQFFEEFKSTTCIVTLRNGSTQANVNFLRIKDTSLLEDPQKIKSILSSEVDIIGADYTLKHLPKSLLNPRENWLLPFTDPEGKNEFLEKLDVLIPLKAMFTHKAERGRAGNSGGSNVIFLESTNNPLAEYMPLIENEFRLPGLRWNKLSRGRRQFILRDSDVEDQKALGVPAEYDDRTDNGLNSEHHKYSGLTQYYDKASQNYKEKWKRIVNDCYDSRVSPDLIIPRADREKHSVYGWTRKEELVISTNFFYLEGFKEIENKGSKETQLKCICGYLMSSFGQIQFELKANNQEGMRKLEGFMIDEFKCLDLNKLDAKEIQKVAEAFAEFDSLNEDVRGDEGVYTIRRKLDEAVGEIIFSRDPRDFNSSKELVDWSEMFLEELVSMRSM
jgi:hypothetical protein